MASDESIVHLRKTHSSIRNRPRADSPITFGSKTKIEHAEKLENRTFSQGFLRTSSKKNEDAPFYRISVTYNGLTLNTVVDARMTPKDIVLTNLQRKFPGDTSPLSLCVQKKNGRVRLEDNVPLYLCMKKKVDWSKKDLVLINWELEEKQKRAQKIKPKDVTIGTVMDLIRCRDTAQLDYLLNSDIPNVFESLDQEGLAPIHAAFSSNNSKIAQMFLDYHRRKDLDLNLKDNQGWSILHHAVSNTNGSDHDDQILRMLIKEPKIHVDSVNMDGNTPLHYFCSKWISPSGMALGKSLISRSNAINSRNKAGETPIHKAIFNTSLKLLMVRLIVEAGGDVNAQCKPKNMTPLHYAVEMKRSDVVKALLHSGASPGLYDSENRTPLDMALIREDVEISIQLRTALRLFNLLKKSELSDLYSKIISSNVNFDEISPENTERLMDDLGINVLGTRLKLKQGLMELKRSNKSLKKEISSAVLRRDSNISVQLLKMHLGSNYQIAHTDLEFTRELGTGTSGRVYKGLFKQQPVAIKVLKAVDKASAKEFKKEFEVMSVLDSPYIVHFIGACLDPKICMVIEFCNRGNLNSFMQLKQEFDWKMGLHFAMCTAFGLEYLHSRNPPIVHRDMKSLNLLVHQVDGDWQVKVADFGLARFIDSYNEKSLKKTCGTWAYLAPEVVDTGHSTKSDIFSMGIILWEIVFRVMKGRYAPPYSDRTDISFDFQIAKAVSEGARPIVPHDCNPLMTLLIKSCLWANADDRPIALHVVRDLQNMQQDFKKNPLQWKTNLNE